MINIFVNKSSNKINLVTDDPSVKLYLETTRTVGQYIPWKKKWGNVTTTTKVYDHKRTQSGVTTFEIGMGWAGYLINVFSSYITKENYDNILKDAIYTEEAPRDIPFPELRDYQNEDILHILKYRRGLVSVYTSYGKTQSIAVLTNYLHSMGKKVLIVAPGKKAMDELVKRVKTLYHLDILPPGHKNSIGVDGIITSGLLNRKDIKDLSLRGAFEEQMKTYDIVLVDEVEYTINPAGEYIFSCLSNAERFYAFSGTADKQGGEMISFINGLSEVVCNNRDLIKWFGPSLVYRMPLTLEIDAIEIQTSALDLIDFNEEELEEGNVYMNVMNRIWTEPGVCNLIVRIAKKYPKLFIPINNLTYILTEWINNYFLGKFRVLLVCAEGYVYYDLQGNKTVLTLQEACDKIKSNEVDIIPSTASGYRALDFPDLENILLIQGKVAGVVLQSVGRVARGKHMNIITLGSKSKKNIPIFSKGAIGRNEMIHNYYKYCNIVDSIVYEDNL